MAVKKKSRSVLKRLRSSERRAEYRGRVRSSARTYLKKAQNLVASGKVEAASEAVQVAISSLDKAASKGVIHKNNAARHKARLMAALNRAKAG